jgi:hypothetical protein
MVEPDHPQRPELQQLLFDALNNIVAVHLISNKSNYHFVRLASAQVLEHDAHEKGKSVITCHKGGILPPPSRKPKPLWRGRKVTLPTNIQKRDKNYNDSKPCVPNEATSVQYTNKKNAWKQIGQYLNTEQPTAATTTTRRIRIRKLKETSSGADKDEHNAVESMASAAASRQGQKLNTEDITIATTTADRTTVLIRRRKTPGASTTGEDNDMQQVKRDNDYGWMMMW